MYPIEIKPASHNAWYSPAESNAVYAARYARTGVTCHWWGDGTGADNHDNIVNYFLQQAQDKIKSVNYVLSDDKITMMVDPDNVAWCSEDGNPTTVSIEFQPTLGDEGYKKGGWLIWQLEKKYKRTLTLYPHSHWFNTTCPGTIDLNRLRSEADKWKAGGYSTEMITTKDDATKLWKLLRPNVTVTDGMISSVLNKSYASFVNGAQGEVGTRDGNLKAQAAKLTDVQTTLTQVKAQDADDQAKLKAALDQLAQAQQLVAPIETTPNQATAIAAKPNFFALLIAAIFHK